MTAPDGSGGAKAASASCLSTSRTCTLIRLNRKKVKGENMAIGNRKKIDEAQIRELIDRWLKALRAKNLDGIMSCYTPDILLFDLLPPLQYLGADAYRKNWAEWSPRSGGRLATRFAT